MMLLQAVLAPIPRFLLEPELDAHPTRWKLEHRTTGSIAWVSIRDRGQSQDSLLATVYDFLSSGILVRREGAYVTSWDDDQSFAERIVPRHITVQGIGLQGPVVTATVMIAPLAPSDRTIVQVPAEPADPGSTLEPIDFGSLENGGARAIHMEVPPPLPARYPASVEISATSVVDRSGTPRDAEIIGIRNEGGPLDQQTNGVVAEIARAMVLALLKDRYHPALIDGKPCQVFSGMVEFPPRTQ
ncbi:MAG TPA: hypothetical protein VHZ09_19385 [Acidobacteriaceae bacterium]|nr:hypothetical protein [Acidobacteriaceae bacterium]